jgi:hypothetical protein
MNHFNDISCTAMDDPRGWHGQAVTYISSSSPHFDLLDMPTTGPGEYSNYCQTFYEATADMHLWPKEKIVCYVDELEIIEDYFDMVDEECELWVDDGDVCTVNPNSRITAAGVPQIPRKRVTEVIKEKHQHAVPLNKSEGPVGQAQQPIDKAQESTRYKSSTSPF